MFTISKRFEFSASHKLDGLDDDHPCSRLHGHNYAVEVELAASSRDEVGFVFDYRKLDPFKRWLDDVLDHRHLNDVYEWNPTAENLAAHLLKEACTILALPWKGEAHDSIGGWKVHVAAVRVFETPKTCAEYRP